MSAPAKFKVDALMRDKHGRHWLIALIVYRRYGRPRYLCFRNGVRSIFAEAELS
jgi:hypothetical protein